MKFPRSGLVVFLMCLILALALFILTPRVYAPQPTSSAPAAQSASVCLSGSSGTVVTFPAEGFTAWFPCMPLRTVRKANAVPFGEIEIVSYEAIQDGVSFAAAYVNYADKLPAAAFDLARSIVLDGAKRSVVRGQPVQNPVYTDLKQGDLSGVGITAEGTNQKLSGRVWVARQTTYQMIVLAPRTVTDEAPIARFLESFVSITPAATPAR